MLFPTDSTGTLVFVALCLRFRSFSRSFMLQLEATPTIKAAQPCALIGQYLNSWRVTFRIHITRGT